MSLLFVQDLKAFCAGGLCGCVRSSDDRKDLRKHVDSPESAYNKRALQQRALTILLLVPLGLPILQLLMASVAGHNLAMVPAGRC